MSMYKAMALHYSDIFPFDPQRADFIAQSMGSDNGRVLDVGCATGELCFALVEKGYEVIGIDYDKDMVSLAEQEAQLKKLNATFSVGDMRHIDKKFESASFDSVCCFGNTLVHLENLKEIEAFFYSVYYLLKPGGHFLYQILNYDYILGNQIDALPEIENNRISFKRSYDFNGPNGRLLFKTELEIKEDAQIYKGSTPLFPLREKDSIKILRKAGFIESNFFGNLSYKKFEPDDFAVYVVATKPE